MKLSIPSTSVKARFFKTLPLGTIYKDPRNGYAYEVKERKQGQTFTKTGEPYIGSAQPVTVEVADTLLKQLNPQRTNIMRTMKIKIEQLKTENKQLRQVISDSPAQFEKAMKEMERKSSRRKSYPKNPIKIQV